ncbi:MAG: 4Fe-4S binding protein [Phycisphaerales bacterium]
MAGDANTAGNGRCVSLPVLSNGDGAGGNAGAPRIAKSKSTRWRAIVLIGVHVLILIHVLIWLSGREVLTPVEPSESMEFVKNGVVNAGIIFFSLAMLSTLVFGRWFCGWACHVVALQDASAALLKRVGIRPRPFRSRLLMYVPFGLAVYMFLWPAIYRWGVHPIMDRFGWTQRAIPDWPGITFELTTSEFWATFPGWMIAVPFFLIIGFACVYFLGAKGFCTYGCPYGGFFAPLDQFAPGRIRVTDACEGCGHCTAVCTSNVRVHEEVAAYGMVVDPGCMKCMDCVSVCPKDALYFGFGRTAANRTVKDASKEPPPRWDLSWPEEILLTVVFLGSFFAFRGVYTMIPMLMAAGMALCATFLTWKAWSILRRPNVSFSRARLRYRGRVTPIGIGFLLIVTGVLALAAHSGAMRLLHWSAGKADERVMMSRESVFGASPLMMPDEMNADAQTAIDRYERTLPVNRGGLGLAPWPGVDVRIGWLKACQQDYDGAVAAFERHLDTWGPSDNLSRDIVFLKRIAMDEEGADAWGRRIVAKHPDHFQTAQAVAGLMIEQDRPEEAIAFLDEQIDALGDPMAGTLPQTEEGRTTRLNLLRVLSLALLDVGQLERGIAVTAETLEIDDSSPGGWTIYARSLAQAGRLDEAATAAERAYELSPNGPAAELVAQILESGGRMMQAVPWRQRAAEAAAAAAEAGAPAPSSFGAPAVPGR